MDFNPLPPHGGRPETAADLDRWEGFQSTPSTRRETGGKVPKLRRFHISIHSLHTEGDIPYRGVFFNPFISIHSLHTEGDYVSSDAFAASHISIHSLHTEGDRSLHAHPLSRADFNPLPPHGGRHVYDTEQHPVGNFNPLPPHGGRPSSTHFSGRQKKNFNPLPPHGGRPLN